MKQPSKVGVVLEIEPQAQPRRAAVREDAAFRILVLADLGGEPHAGPIRPVRIDRDDYDALLERIGPRSILRITDGGRPVIARFEDIDHFHPDHIRETLPLFRELRTMRDRLNDPRTFQRAAREILEGADPDGDEGAADTAADPDVDATQSGPSGSNGGGGSGSLLDRMLDETTGPAPAPTGAGPAHPTPPDDLQAFIREAVAPHIVPGEDPLRGPLVERVDAAAGDLMRHVLHDPAFRAVESSWRSLYRMVREIETGPRLTIDVVDLPRTVLEADLAPDRPLEQTTLHRLMVDEPAEPWSVVIADHAFGPDSDDIALLSRIAEIARAADVSVLAEGRPAFSGCPGFEGLPEPARWASVDSPEWTALRKGPAARHIGLVQPRYLVRLPYGRDGEPTERFDFEELSDPPLHDEYLWGNPAYVCGILLARAFMQDGPAMRPGLFLELDGLPLHLVRRDGTTESQPCAESLMTERAAARIGASGLMALASMKDSDRVRLTGYTSIADPPAPLAGPWTL
jgi:type VI secretion system protein ImpC